jgi:hypothetical protein
MRSYGNRVVAFMDILGMSSLLSDPVTSRRYAEAIAPILSAVVRKQSEFYLMLRHVRTGEEVEVQLCPPVAHGSVVTSISDAIVISVPYGPRLSAQEKLRRIFYCLQSVFWLQRSLMTLGVLVRGGVAIGGLIHKAHLVLGDGLVQAHDLEQQAVYPRTLISSDLIDVLLKGPMPDMVLFRNRIAHMVRQDLDGHFFVDYIPPDPVLGSFYLHRYIDDVVGLVLSDLKQTRSVRVKMKLRWMVGYLARTNEWLNASLAHEVTRCHAEAAFSNTYYRTRDNIVTYAEALKQGAEES